MYAIEFLLIFAVAVVAYGFVLHKTGNKELLPYRAMHSIRNKQDVIYVGLWTMRVGAVMAAVLLVALAIVKALGID